MPRQRSRSAGPTTSRRRPSPSPPSSRSSTSPAPRAPPPPPHASTSPRIISEQEHRQEDPAVYRRRSGAATASFFTRDSQAATPAPPPDGAYSLPAWAAPGFEPYHHHQNRHGPYYADDDEHQHISAPAPPISQRLIDSFGRSTPRAPDEKPSSRHGTHHRNRRRSSVSVNQTSSASTCRLTLVVYRPGSRGVVVSHVRAAHPRRFGSQSSFRHALRKDPGLACTDEELFRQMRRVYSREMCGWWRAWVSLRAVQGFRLLSYGDCRLRPAVVPLGESTMQEVFYAYRHPERLRSGDKSSNPDSLPEHRDIWIDWIYRLRDGSGTVDSNAPQDALHRRHALEFVEGWDGVRILVAGSIVVVAPVVAVVVWIVLGGEPGVVLAVGGFALAVGVVGVLLLAVLSVVMPSH